jgi:hypothetical protein
MGIGSDTIGLLIRLKHDGYLPLRPAVMELGAQQLANTFLRDERGIAELAKVFGCRRPFRMPRPSNADGPVHLLDADAPFARGFWKWLGFQYAAIDIDGSPGSIALDLNWDECPASALGKYHLVTNFGTTEHVTNQLNAFKIAHDLTAPGGVMIHHVPTQGMINHGLVNYNPKFFWLLGRSNGYRVLDFDFFIAPTSYQLPTDILDYTAGFRPDIRDRMKHYQSTDAMLLIVFQKVYDIPFVAPVDVQTGTRTDNKMLEGRYWTVFRANAFVDLPIIHRIQQSRIIQLLHTPPLELAKKVMRRIGFSKK